MGCLWALVTTFCVLIGISAAAAKERGDPELGLQVATESCASCHAILRVEDRSPNPHAFRTHRRRSGHVTATALQVALQSPHKSMPNLMLEPRRIEGSHRLHHDAQDPPMTGEP